MDDRLPRDGPTSRPSAAGGARTDPTDLDLRRLRPPSATRRWKALAAFPDARCRSARTVRPAVTGSGESPGRQRRPWTRSSTASTRTSTSRRRISWPRTGPQGSVEARLMPPVYGVNRQPWRTATRLRRIHVAESRRAAPSPVRPRAGHHTVPPHGGSHASGTRRRGSVARPAAAWSGMSPTSSYSVCPQSSEPPGEQGAHRTGSQSRSRRPVEQAPRRVHGAAALKAEPWRRKHRRVSRQHLAWRAASWPQEHREHPPQPPPPSSRLRHPRSFGSHPGRSHGRLGQRRDPACRRRWGTPASRLSPRRPPHRQRTPSRRSRQLHGERRHRRNYIGRCGPRNQGSAPGFGDDRRHRSAR